LRRAARLHFECEAPITGRGRTPSGTTPSFSPPSKRQILLMNSSQSGPLHHGCNAKSPRRATKRVLNAHLPDQRLEMRLYLWSSSPGSATSIASTSESRFGDTARALQAGRPFCHERAWPNSPVVVSECRVSHRSSQSHVGNSEVLCDMNHGPFPHESIKLGAFHVLPQLQDHQSKSDLQQGSRQAGQLSPWHKSGSRQAQSRA
jgi:hypothetical protein